MAISPHDWLETRSSPPLLVELAVKGLTGEKGTTGAAGWLQQTNAANARHVNAVIAVKSISGVGHKSALGHHDDMTYDFSNCSFSK